MITVATNVTTNVIIHAVAKTAPLEFESELESESPPEVYVSMWSLIIYIKNELNEILLSV